MPPVTRQIVSRPLESPRMSAHETDCARHEATSETPKMMREHCDMVSNGPEIGDMDEGVVEGSEDTGNAEYIFTCVQGQHHDRVLRPTAC